jgi:pentatricopeptide repeat protein
MTFTLPSLNCIWDQTIAGIGTFGFGQTEIVIFMTAFTMHFLFFGRYRIPNDKSKGGGQSTSKRAPLPEPIKTKGRRSKETPEAAADLLDFQDEIQNIKMLLHDGEIKEALRSLEVLHRGGILLKTAVLNDLVDAAVKISFDAAWAVVSRMRTFGVKADRLTCLALLRGIKRKANQSHVTRALSVMDEMDSEVDEILLNAALEACINTGSAELLTAQFDKLRLSTKIQMKNPHSYASLIRAYGYIGNMQGIWETWRCMYKCRVPPTSITIGCMVEALTTNGDVDASYEIVQAMMQNPQSQPMVNSVIYGSVLKGFSHQKKFDHVWAIYEEMLAHKIQFSIVTFNTLLDACARSGDLARIPGLLESMAAQGLEPNLITYGIVIKGYCQENKLKEALAVWESMVCSTKYRPDEIMYNTILDGCARKGMYERGMALLDDMQQAGIQPTNFTLSVLVKLASRANMLDRAFELAQEISKKYKFHLNVHVFNNLIQACVNGESLPRAFEVLEQMVRERVRPDNRTYTLLIRACIAAREGKDVSGLVRAAMGLQDVHRVFANAASLAQLQKGLPAELLVEAITSISEQRNIGFLGMALYKDLQKLRHVKLPASYKGGLLGPGTWPQVIGQWHPTLQMFGL